MPRIRLFLKQLEENNSKQISFRHCKCYKIPFIQKPTQTYCLQTQPTDPIEDLLISSEISHLLEKGAIEEVDVSASLLKQPFPCH